MKMFRQRFFERLLGEGAPPTWAGGSRRVFDGGSYGLYVEGRWLTLLNVATRRQQQASLIEYVHNVGIPFADLPADFVKYDLSEMAKQIGLQKAVAGDAKRIESVMRQVFTRLRADVAGTSDAFTPDSEL